MVDHFSTYLYQKRGFYPVSRRVPKEVENGHSKQRIVLALDTRTLKYSQVICQRLLQRWLVALISDTGMRVAEAAGLHIDDLKLDKDIPYVNIKPHPWRPLKTRGSQRQVPLAGASIWTAQRIMANASSCFAFPRFTDNHRCNANSASNALNKWLQTSFHRDIVVHGRLDCYRVLKSSWRLQGLQNLMDSFGAYLTLHQ